MEPHEVAYQLASTGKFRQLKQYLQRRPKDERKRVIATKHNGATCLIVACRNGHVEVVEFLVEHCGASMELAGLVSFEGENIEGAPPLWCASAAGHLKVVKYLVSKGANVNSTTKSNSTALRAACFDGHFEIVKYLVENGADIEIANRHGHTCLMIACYKGHWAIAKYLISKGADLNRRSVKGNTALHDCAECGSLDIMKLLLAHEAKMAPDSYSMTPLLAAAVTGHAAIVDYLLTRPECTSREKVHALELLGATFVDKKHDMLQAYNYWKSSLERRRAAPAGEETLDKTATVRATPIEAYDYASEFMTLAELDEIIADPDEMRMQALLIRERILGPTHPDTTYYIRYRGAVYADCGNFRKCILLWLYALDTQQKCLDPLHPMIQSSLLSFTELFQYMQKQLASFMALQGPTHGHHANNTRDGPSDDSMADTSTDSDSSARHRANNSAENTSMLDMYTATVLKIMQKAVEEIKRGMTLMKAHKAKQLANGVPLSRNVVPLAEINQNDSTRRKNSLTLETNCCENHASAEQQSSSRRLSDVSKVTAGSNGFDMAHFDRTLVVIVHFLVVVAESLRHSSPEDAFKLKKLVYTLVKMNPTNSKGSSLVHLASSRDSSSVIKNHTLSSFPSTDVLKLLLECGADANSLDSELNSALHLAAANRQNALTTTTATSLAAAMNPQGPAVRAAEPVGAAGAEAPATGTMNTYSERDKIIYLLLNAGCHLDSVNAAGKTPSDLYRSGKMYNVINPTNYLTLQCLVAKVIQKNKIAYQGLLTPKLAAFVAIH